MTNRKAELSNIFELEEIVKGFLKESKNNTNTPFQIDFGVSYRPSKDKDIVEETVSVFLTKNSKGKLFLQLEEGEDKTGYINNISLNKELGLQTMTVHKWGANPTFKTRCFISKWIIEMGLNSYVPILKSFSVAIHNIKSVGFVDLEPTLKEVA